MDTHVQKHFQMSDPILYGALVQVLKISDQLMPTTTDNYFAHLCEAIVSQQHSEKAGATIWKRFVSLFPEGIIKPEFVLALHDDAIRAVGPSRSKISYLKNLSQSVQDGVLILEKLPSMTDRDVITELTKIKGIGPWTAEMFLMFALGREDVFSHGDLGLRNAMKRLYAFKREPTRKQIEKIVATWSPYKTYACKVLWRSLEL